MSVGMFMVGVFLARAVSKEEYGIYVLGWSFVSIAMGIHRAMVVLPFTVYSPKLSDLERDTYQGSGIAHTVIIGGIFIVALLLWAMWPADNVGQSHARLANTLPLIGLLIIPLLMREYMRSALFARLEFVDGARINTLASTLLVLSIVTVYLSDMLILETAYACLFITSFIAATALLIKNQSVIPTMGRVWSDVVRNFQLGRWLLVNAVAFAVLSQAYVWLLLYLKDAAAVAAFGACMALSVLLGPFLRAVNTLILPKMAHSNDPRLGSSDLPRLLRISLLCIAIPYLIWLVIGGFFAEEIMIFFYSGKYTGYGTLVVLLILKTTIDSLATPATSALQTLERPDVTTVSLVLGAAVALLLGYVLTRSMGLVGVGITACVAASVITGWKWYFLLRITSRTQSIGSET